MTVQKWNIKCSHLKSYAKLLSIKNIIISQINKNNLIFGSPFVTDSIFVFLLVQNPVQDHWESHVLPAITSFS